MTAIDAANLLRQGARSGPAEGLVWDAWERWREVCHECIDAPGWGWVRTRHGSMYAGSPAHGFSALSGGG